jgi:ankyrin repeat protein
MSFSSENQNFLHHLEKISLLVHVARFSCDTPKRLCVFSQVSSSWSETIREYSVPKNNILEPIYKLLLFNNNLDAIKAQNEGISKNEEDDEKENDFEGPAPPAMNKFTKLAVRMLIRHLDPSLLIPRDDPSFFWRIFFNDVSRATISMIAYDFYSVSRFLLDRIQFRLNSGGGFFGNERQTILQLAASHKNNEVATELCRQICEFLLNDDERRKNSKFFDDDDDDDEEEEKGKEKEDEGESTTTSKNLKGSEVLKNLLIDSEQRDKEFARKHWLTLKLKNGLPNSPRPLDIAARNGNLPLVQLLIDNYMMVQQLLPKDVESEEKQGEESNTTKTSLKMVIESCLFAASTSTSESAQLIFDQLLKDGMGHVEINTIVNESLQNRFWTVKEFSGISQVKMSYVWIENDHLSNCCASGNLELLKYFLSLPENHCVANAPSCDENNNTYNNKLKWEYRFDLNSYVKYALLKQNPKFSPITRRFSSFSNQDPPFIAAIRNKQTKIIKYITEYLPQVIEREMKNNNDDENYQKQKLDYLTTFLTDEHFVSCKKSSCQYPALTFAVHTNQPEIAEIILNTCQKFGVDLKARTSKSWRRFVGPSNGDSALHVAVLQNNLKCVQLLLQHPASPHFIDKTTKLFEVQQNSWKNSPLHLAVNRIFTMDKEIILLLLDCFDKNFAWINADLMTPFDILENEKKKVVRKMIAVNEDPDEDSDLLEFLNEMIKLFEEKGCDKTASQDSVGFDSRIAQSFSKWRNQEGGKRHSGLVARWIKNNLEIREKMHEWHNNPETRFPYVTSTIRQVRAHLNLLHEAIAASRIHVLCLLLLHPSDGGAGIAEFGLDSYQIQQAWSNNNNNNDPNNSENYEKIDDCPILRVCKNNNILHTLAQF